MPGTKANRHATKTDTLISVVNQARQARGLDRHRIIPRVSQLPSGGGAQAATGGVGASGNFLDPVGDTMIGPIAFSPQASFIDTSDPLNPSMDIGINSGDYSTYVFVTGDDSELRTIFGASFNGQLLYLQYTGAGVLTIKQGDGTDGGNIVTNTGGDLVVNFGEVVIMLFDPGGGADPAVSGAWRVVAGGGSGGGGITELGDLTDVDFPIPLVNDQVLTFNGTTLLWENKASPSGGMATDLSNMSDPTVPTVPLSMNLQDIQGVNNLDFDNSGFRTITSLSNLIFFQSNQQISSLAQGLFYNVDVGQEHIFTVGGAEVVKIEEVSGGIIQLDMLGNRVTDIDSLNLARVGQTGQFLDGFTLGGNSEGGGRINWDTDANLIFTESGTTRASFVKFLGVGYTLSSIVGVHLANSGNSTVFDGEIRLDGNDVFIGSGGRQVNITTLAQIIPNSIFEENTSVTVIDAGQGSVTTTIDGTVRSTFSAVGLTLNASLDLGLNAIDSVNGVFPNNSFSDLGSATRFWGEAFIDTINFENVENKIIGDTGGMEYQARASGSHVWKVGGVTPLVLGSTLLQLSGGVNLGLSGQDITGVRDFTFASSSSTLDMNGGRTDDCGTITMRSGNLLNMNGGDIINVDDMFVNDDLTISGDTEMNGDLNHDGNRVGFFGQPTQTRKTAALPTGTSNNELFIALFNIIQALGNLSGFGYGLVNSNQ